MQFFLASYAKTPKQNLFNHQKLQKGTRFYEKHFPSKAKYHRFRA